MKTINLIEGLTEKELKALYEHSLVKQRKAPKTLLQYLQRCIEKKQSYSRETASIEVFGEKYDKKTGLKLRQAVYTINQACREILIQAQFRKNLERDQSLSDYLYAEALLERKLNKQFDTAYNKAIKNNPYRQPVQLIDTEDKMFYLKSIRLAELPFSEKHFRELRDHNRQWKEYTKLNSARNLSAAENRYARVSRELFNRENADNYLKMLPIEARPEKLDLSPYKHDYFVRFQCIRRDISIETGPERVKHLLNYVDLLKEPPFQSDFYQSIRGSIYNGLGLEYAVSGDLELAEKYFKASIEIGDFLKFSQRGISEFNLISLYWEMAKYQKGINTYHKYLDVFQDGPESAEVRTLVAACYLMNGQPEKCKELVFENSRLSDFKQINDRHMLAICFYTEGTVDLMVREMENLLQSMKTKAYSNHEAASKSTRLLLRYARAKQLPETDQVTPLAKLKTDVNKSFDKRVKHSGLSVALTWLHKELGT